MDLVTDLEKQDAIIASIAAALKTAVPRTTFNGKRRIGYEVENADSLEIPDLKCMQLKDNNRMET